MSTCPKAISYSVLYATADERIVGLFFFFFVLLLAIRKGTE